MKNLVIFILVIIIGGFIFYIKEGPGSEPNRELRSKMEILMKAEESALSKNAGMVDIDPRDVDYTDAREFAETGVTTAVVFYDATCEHCRVLYSQLELLTEKRPDVSIKVVHVNRSYPWPVKFNINVRYVPYVVLLDKEESVIAEDDGKNREGVELLRKWIMAELTEKNITDQFNRRLNPS